MDELVEIQKMRLTRLDNALHVLYHSDAYDIVHAVDITKLGLTLALLNEWNGNLLTEKDLNLEAQANHNTKLLNEKNEERNKLITFIFNVVRTYQRSPDADEAKAATQLDIITRRYRGIQYGSKSHETVHIDGLLIDLKKAEMTPLLATLRLTSAVSLLETANAEFNKYRKARTASRAKKDLPKIVEVRPKTDAVYERVIFMLQAAYLSGSATVDKELIRTVAKQLNQRMDEINETFSQILARRKSDKSKDPKTPKEPKKPRKPKDKDDPDIRLPETEEPKHPGDSGKDKKPEGGGTPKPGGGGKKPEGGGSGAEGGGKQPKEGGSGSEGGGGASGGGPEIHLPEN